MTSALTQRDGKRRRRLLVFAAVVLLVLAAAITAGAGNPEKYKQEPKRAINIDAAPPLHFEIGTLRRGLYSSWMIGEGLTVAFTERTVIIDEASGNQIVDMPYEGRPVSVSGHYVGGTLVLHTCKMRDPMTYQQHHQALTMEEAIAEGIVRTEPVDMPH